MKPRRPLESLHIAKPCSASWEAMTGDATVRQCEQCNHKVYNLSGMTREEAEALVSNTETGMCVRFVRQDGMVMTRDCGDPIPANRSFGLARLALVAIPLLAGCSESPKEEVIGNAIRSDTVAVKPPQSEVQPDGVAVGFISTRSPAAMHAEAIKSAATKKTKARQP